MLSTSQQGFYVKYSIFHTHVFGPSLMTAEKWTTSSKEAIYTIVTLEQTPGNQREFKEST